MIVVLHYQLKFFVFNVVTFPVNKSANNVQNHEVDVVGRINCLSLMSGESCQQLFHFTSYLSLQVLESTSVRAQCRVGEFPLQDHSWRQVREEDVLGFSGEIITDECAGSAGEIVLLG